MEAVSCRLEARRCVHVTIIADRAPPWARTGPGYRRRRSISSSSFRDQCLSSTCSGSAQPCPEQAVERSQRWQAALLVIGKRRSKEGADLLEQNESFLGVAAALVPIGESPMKCGTRAEA
jgi:hypothetical protein